jgi:hypothetical protein
MTTLDWPDERAQKAAVHAARFVQNESNICLDLHGDPQRAGLCVFSDGNHHMALEEALQVFLARHPRVGDVFYATTPPRVIVEALKSGGVRLGNLTVSARPHVFISPEKVLDGLVKDGYVRSHRPFARIRGSALLVKKGNPSNIRGVADLARTDVKVFLSNPVTETVSYEAYAETLRKVAARAGVTLDILDPSAKHPRVIYGESIHHREAPQCVADGRADVAVVYHHLALRYVRIFPATLEMLPLGRGAGADPEHAVSTLNIGLIGDGGEWGGRLLDFMTGTEVAAIYEKHGLVAA